MTSDNAKKIRLGTRASELAMWQATHVEGLLKACGVETEIVRIATTGDLDQKTDFGSLGAKGVFVKEIEAALLEGSIDIAVHSLKDLPTDLPDGLVLGAALERDSPLDAWVSRDGKSFADLAEGATVATGSLRRGAQILAMRPDLKIVPLRGNVPTRIQKIKDGAADATLLAIAGMKRLGLDGEAAQTFSTDEVTPSMSQGAVGLETRAGELAEVLGKVEHALTRQAIDAERAFIARIGGGCKTPVGVLAEPMGDGWKITGMLASADGASLVRKTRDGILESDLNGAAVELAEAILASASDEMIATLDRPPVAPS